MESSREFRAKSEDEKPEPKDMSHHYSDLSKARKPNAMKAYYKYFMIPGIGNIAGGVPNSNLFPFDTLEAQIAKPQRWQPSPNYPEEQEVDVVGSKLKSTSLSDAKAASHVTVPHDAKGDLMKKVDITTVLQYGLANGYPPLVSFIRQFARDVLHPNVPYKGGPEVIMTVGNTDGMSKTLEVFSNIWVEGKNDIRERTGILTEIYAYPAATNQAQPRGIQVVPVEIDDDGMKADGPGGLRDVLENWDFSKGKRPHLMYTVTMGHNPTATLLKLERRRALYALCSKYDVIIIEDDPYWYLQFPSAEIEEAKARNLPPPARKELERLPLKSGYDFIDSLQPSFLGIDVDGRVVRLDTFSKTVAPGCRLGWITAAPVIVERLLRCTESTTQQPSGFVQGLIGETLLGPQPENVAKFNSRSAKDKAAFTGWNMDGWVRWLAGLRGQYERRMNRMCQVLEDGAYQLKQSTPVRESDAEWGVISKTQLYSFSWPRGGMFLWLRVNFEQHPLWKAVSSKGTPIDGVMLSSGMVEFMTHKPWLVLIAPGTMFSSSEQIGVERGWAFFRLCFAAVSEEDIEACSKRLVQGIHRYWRVKTAKELEDLLEDGVGATLEAQEEGEGDAQLQNLGSWMGC